MNERELPAAAERHVAEMRPSTNWAGKRVTVIGLGIEGVDLVRYFAARGAQVTVSDAKSAERLQAHLAALSGVPVTLSLGANRAESAADADLIAVSQGAPLDLPPIVAARGRGVPITSLTQLFLGQCRGIIVGVSGSSGKTTTTSLVGAIFAASGRRMVLGGNLGRPLLSRLDEITPDTWVILEVSHSQLLLTSVSPHIACLTNITPNHLDRFSWDEYVGLKRNLIAHQHSDDVAILNYDNPITRSMTRDTPAQSLFFSLTGDMPADGACEREGMIVWRRDGSEDSVLPSADIRLRGRHNVENALAAVAVCGACGIAPGIMAQAIRDFRGVPHRLEFTGVVAGARYYNDSIATAPERTLAGMRTFDEPLVLLLGGRDKHLPLEELGAEVNRRCRAVICFGEAGDLLLAACRAAHPHGVCGTVMRRVETLDQAVALAARLAQPGDAVLLSPACTSFDAFDNFEQRGEAFRQLVRALGSSTRGTDDREEEAAPSPRK